MNRYGEAIRTQRLALGWSEKTLARKAGITEKVLHEAESGKRILSEALAERLLACMCGPSDTPLLNPYAEAEPQQAQEEIQQAPVRTTHSLAMAALGQVANVPIVDIKGGTVGTRPVALEQGKIGGFAAGGAFYLRCPDDGLRAFRIHKGDMLLMAPDQTPEEGAVVLIAHEGGRMLAKLVRIGDSIRPARMEAKLEVWEDMPKLIARALSVEFAP